MFTHSNAATAAPSSTRALPLSVRRNARIGVLDSAVQRVRPVRAIQHTPPINTARPSTQPAHQHSPRISTPRPSTHRAKSARVDVEDEAPNSGALEVGRGADPLHVQADGGVLVGGGEEGHAAG